MNKQVAKRVIDDIHKVPIFERHILKGGGYIGDAHIFSIMTFSDSIEVLVDIRRNVFNKALDEFVKEHEDVLRFAYFVSGEGFIPYLRFSVKKEYQ